MHPAAPALRSIIRTGFAALVALAAWVFPGAAGVVATVPAADPSWALGSGPAPPAAEDGLCARPSPGPGGIGARADDESRSEPGCEEFDEEDDLDPDGESALPGPFTAVYPARRGFWPAPASATRP